MQGVSPAAQADRSSPLAALALSPLARWHARVALVAVVFGLLALAGWLTGEPRLYRFLDGRPALSPMTALGLLVAASAIVLVRQDPRRALAFALVQIAGGIVVGLAHAGGIPDGGWLPQPWWSSPLTAAGFALSGLVTALFVLGRVLQGQLLAFGVLLVCVLFGLAHVFPQADLYRVMPGTGVAIPTVLSFVALSIAQLLAYPESGASAALSPGTTAGRAGLRLLAAGAALALVVTGVVVAGFRRDTFDAETAVLLVAWSALALLGASLWSVAAAVHRSERARLQAEVERNQLSQLVAAAVTHDLRSPLQAATLSATLLERTVTDPKALVAVQRLQRSHRRLERLLRSLLDSLALGAGQTVQLRVAAVSLDAVARDVIEENEGALRLRVDLQGQADGWWDADALFRVLENLLLNAVKYGEPRAPIHCRIERLPGDRVALRVSNRGLPIPPAEWDSIFLPFARAQAVRDAPQVGWGVGLAYARSAVHGHGGTVRVAESGPEGTTFEVLLPRDSRPFMRTA
jgi:signal transduction histidine kinase